MKILTLAWLLTFLLLFQTKSARGTIPHSATLNWNNSSCTTAKPCSIQVWRAQCASATSCPTYIQGSASFVNPPTSSTTVNGSAGATSTTWQVIDADPNLADSTTYVWVATNAYTSNPTGYSSASQPWSGTTTAPVQTPAAPVTGTGNTIQ